MNNRPSHSLIAELRAERRETLAEFAAAIGCSSKGRMSEIENGKVSLTVEQALRLEDISGGRIDAATLNADVAAARHGLPPAVACCDLCDRRADDPAVRCCTAADCGLCPRQAA